MTVPIPDDFKDLFEKPVYAALVTVMPSGQPQASMVWVDYDGTNVLINTVRGRQKDRNMQRNARVTILLVDPTNPYRWIEIRGKVAEGTEEGALDHINKMSMKYRGEPDYYTRSPQLRGKQERVLYKIEPTKVNPYKT